MACWAIGASRLGIIFPIVRGRKKRETVAEFLMRHFGSESLAIAHRVSPAFLARGLRSPARLVAILVAFLSLATLPSRAAETAPSPTAASRHWAFQPLQAPPPEKPGAGSVGETFNRVDSYVLARLKAVGLSQRQEASAATLLRRAAFVLTGLPPTPDEIRDFLNDRQPGAYERRVDRYLCSPRYAERWAKHWLDAAGYADSNGYFNADSDRPHAYRYRDYVIRSFNQDTPFDQFVREQLAGDELSGWKPGQPVSPAVRHLLEATHFLRNGQDGSGESDGNPDEVRTDRYYALESAMQIVGASLLGLTVQCAKCHDHKFEPFSQQDYYRFQAFLYPAFNIEKWLKPNERLAQAALPGELEDWQRNEKRLDGERTSLRQEFNSWFTTHRPRGEILLIDRFPDGERLAGRWSNRAPSDDAPAGSPAVQLDVSTAPGAEVKDGQLLIREGGGTGDRWLCTQHSYDWRPATNGAWIQVTFDLVATQIPGQGGSAERIGYLIAAHDFDDNSTSEGGNLLIDGNPGGATSVHLDYPGSDSKSKGWIGGTGYSAGHNYGVRVTRRGPEDFLLEHLVDGAIDGEGLKLRAADLPPGGFAFEYCCGRSFAVDNVVIERSNETLPGWSAIHEAFAENLKQRKGTLDASLKTLNSQRTPKPGVVAWVTDLSPEPPTVHLLQRGSHKTPGETVEPAFPAFLSQPNDLSQPAPWAKTTTTTGRRRAWAEWLTAPGSRQAALLARVTVNRIWQHCFESGLVATPENLGLSGAKPSHPELLNALAEHYVNSGWSTKALLRLIVTSATFRQASEAQAQGMAVDPANVLLWRYPLHRLDAESIRDATLAAAGVLGSKTGGPYVPTPRDASGEVVVDETKSEAHARSIFLQHRRTQVPNFLSNFDAPSIVFNCTRRPSTTMPLQSLSLLNSEFSLRRARDLAARLKREAGPSASAQIELGYLLTAGRLPEPAESHALAQFLIDQRQIYGDSPESESKARTDVAQTLLSLNSFLYLE